MERLNQLNSAVLSNGKVTGSNPVEALIFFQASSFQLLKLEKFTAMIILHFHLQPQFKNELFHIHFTVLS